MMIPFVNALKATIIGRARPALMPPMVAAIDYDVSVLDRDPEMFLYRGSVEVRFEQIAPPNAHDMVAKHAVRSITHHLYGPIEEELRRLEAELWELGADTQSKPMKRISAMIDTLRRPDVS